MATANSTAPKRRKPTRVNKTHAFTVRMNDEQSKIVAQAAEQRALDVASWIRMVAFEAAKAQTAGT